MNSELTVTGNALEIRKRQLTDWILKFESVSLICIGHFKHCFENFPASLYQFLFIYDKPYSYFDILLLETGFSVMYLSEELLGSHIPDLLKCFGHFTS
jgi:hypothetical protein